MPPQAAASSHGPPPLRLAVIACLAARAAAAWADDGDADVCHARERCGELGIFGTNPEGYYWRRRGGGNELPTGSPSVGPFDLAGGPSWTWPNELDEQVRHSPLIDDKMDIYIVTATRIRKFSPDGSMKWLWETGPLEGKMTTGATLHQGTLYALSRTDADLHVHAIDMESGKVKWARSHDKYVFADGNSLFIYNNTILFPLRDHWENRPTLLGQDGNNQIAAVSASDGALLWEWTADDGLWNFMPSTPGDGTFLISSQCGGVYRLTLAGELVWRAGRPNPGHFCGTGGGVLGPNGLFYAEFNDFEANQGVVAAHRVSDGALVWERPFPGVQGYGGWQYPAVGRIAPRGRLAVVAPLGGITAPPTFRREPAWVPYWIRTLAFHHLYLKSSWFRRTVLEVPLLPNAVAALDAATGETIWWIEEPPWDRVAMAGDEETDVERLARFERNPSREDAICLPDTQGIPLIAGDGTVYASSSHGGNLFSLNDRNGDGALGPGEVSNFPAGIGFLNSPSLAPGILVAAPCWGPTYVFRDSSRR